NVHMHEGAVGVVPTSGIAERLAKRDDVFVLHAFDSEVDRPSRGMHAPHRSRTVAGDDEELGRGGGLAEVIHERLNALDEARIDPSNAVRDFLACLLRKLGEWRDGPLRTTRTNQDRQMLHGEWSNGAITFRELEAIHFGAANDLDGLLHARRRCRSSAAVRG